jgi:uncharacterized protein YgbK (DUF1537 family)
MTLLTGGSAVAAPLPALYLEDGLLRAAPPAPRPTIGPAAIVLSGSCSAMTRAQVAAFSGSGPSLRLDPLALAADGDAEARAWLAAQDPAATPLIYATADPDDVRAAQDALGVAEAGALVEDALARLALDARDRGARRFVVAGGETAGAVTRALGVTRLTIGAEIAPGVPWTFSESGGHAVALALKSGNFGAETFFADALAALDAP